MITNKSEREPWSTRLARALPFVGVGMLVVVACLAILVQRNSQNVDRVDDRLEDVSESVGRLEQFVDEMEAGPSSEQQAENDAIAEAVRLVPELKSILCEEFPQASACQQQEE
jgi:uncharacterized protein YoxC